MPGTNFSTHEWISCAFSKDSATSLCGRYEFSYLSELGASCTVSLPSGYEFSYPQRFYVALLERISSRLGVLGANFLSRAFSYLSGTNFRTHESFGISRAEPLQAGYEFSYL